MGRNLIQRIHNPHNRQCECDPDCWCQRTALGRAIKWWFPGRYVGLHKNRALEAWKRSKQPARYRNGSGVSKRADPPASAGTADPSTNKNTQQSPGLGDNRTEQAEQVRKQRHASVGITATVTPPQSGQVIVPPVVTTIATGYRSRTTTPELGRP